MKDYERVLQYSIQYQQNTALENCSFSSAEKPFRPHRQISREEVFSFPRLKAEYAATKGDFIVSEIRQRLHIDKNKPCKDLDPLTEEIRSAVSGGNSCWAPVEARLDGPLRDRSKNLEADKSEIKRLCDSRSFTIAYPLYRYRESGDKSKDPEKLFPLFLFTCHFEDQRVIPDRVRLCHSMLKAILSSALDIPASEVSLEHESNVIQYASDIGANTDKGDLEHVYQLCVKQFQDTFSLPFRDSLLNRSKYTPIHESLLCIGEAELYLQDKVLGDLNQLNTALQTQPLPPLLQKYMLGNDLPKLQLEELPQNLHLGSYPSPYPLRKKQYQIVHSLAEGRLLSVEGPPGTGKTTLLKEMIAASFTQRAARLAELWDEPWTTSVSRNHLYYIPPFSQTEFRVNSIVMTSKNREAIDNVGGELNREIPYFTEFAKLYDESYSGMLCAKLGNYENLMKFKDFLYQVFCPALERVPTEQETSEAEELRLSFQCQLGELRELEARIRSCFAQRLPKEQRWAYDPVNRQKWKNGLQAERDGLKRELSRLRREHHVNSEYEERLDQRHEALEAQIQALTKEERDWEEKLDTSNTILKNCEQVLKSFFQRFFAAAGRQAAKGFRKKHKKTDCQSFEKELKAVKSQQITCRNELCAVEAEALELQKKQKVLTEQENDLDRKLEALDSREKHWKEAMALQDELQPSGREKDWPDASFACAEELSDFWLGKRITLLRQELFQAAVELNRRYLLCHRTEVLENLRLFWGQYILQSFYSPEPYLDEDTATAIRSLWNTFFLCFPVATTTLDSFASTTFQLLPGCIDLLLVDEAGQVPPPMLLTPLYRSRCAVIVGDIKQIEPIYASNLPDTEALTHTLAEHVRVEGRSAQAQARESSDVWEGDKNVILTDHFRCEPNIIGFSNQYVYHGQLVCCTKDKPDKPFGGSMVAFDVRGVKDHPQHVNQAEIAACVNLVRELRTQQGDSLRIAVITPFAKQNEALKTALKAAGYPEDDVPVGTTHTFQGKEADCVIFSLVLDGWEYPSLLQFIDGKCNLLNVAVTRAKSQFILVGNLKRAATAQGFLKDLLEYISAHGQIYSLYLDESDGLRLSENNYSWEILKLFAAPPEATLDSPVSLSLQKLASTGLLVGPADHHEFLRAALAQAEREVLICSPWVSAHVVTEDFLADLQSQKERGNSVHVRFGYDSSSARFPHFREVAEHSKQSWINTEQQAELLEKLYGILQGGLLYDPPLHSKMLLVDSRYLLIGSHNWLSNAGKTPPPRQKEEVSCLLTNESTIRYVKQEFFQL